MSRLRVIIVIGYLAAIGLIALGIFGPHTY
jgi:hypothetical protein